MSVIGTPMIQSNIERIMVSFMSCNKIIRLLPYEFFTSCPVKRHLVSENASRFPQKSALKLSFASHLHSWPVHLLVDSLIPLIAAQGGTGLERLPGWSPEYRSDHNPNFGYVAR